MRPRMLDAEDRWVRVLVVAWALVGVCLLLAGAGLLLAEVSRAFVPFLFALVLVYLFRAPVSELERRGWSRGLAVGVCYLVALGVLALVGFFIVPPVSSQVRDFVAAFPGYYDRAYALWLDLQDQFQALVVPAWLNEALLNLRQSVSAQFAEWSAALAKQMFSVGGRALEFLFNGLLALVVGFWLLKDLPKLRQEFVLLAGPKRREEASLVVEKVSHVLSGYLRGQVIISAATAVIVAAGLTVIGVPYSLVIGLLAGLLNVVPWFGPAVTAVIAGISAAFVSPWMILAAVGVVVAAQQITDIFITPRVMSSQVDLHPLVVIFSLLAGSALFGFVGLVLAIPVAAIAKGLFVHYFEKYTDSKLTSEQGALFRTRPASRAAECASAEPAGDRAAEGDAAGPDEEDGS